MIISNVFEKRNNSQYEFMPHTKYQNIYFVRSEFLICLLKYQETYFTPPEKRNQKY